MHLAEKTKIVSASLHLPRLLNLTNVQGCWGSVLRDEHVRLILFRGRTVLEHWHDVNSNGRLEPFCQAYWPYGERSLNRRTEHIGYCLGI